MSAFADCRECKHGQRVKFKDRLCDVMNLPKPIEHMRDGTGECGPEAMLFEPLEKRYAEFDE